MDLIIKLYQKERLGTVEIAKKFGVSTATIGSRLKLSGITLRSNKEAQTLRSVQGKSTGVNASAWNGGRKINRGYVEIYAPNHHRANAKGYVREHILVWEKANGEKIKKGWVVHHLNGIKDDNRPENLQPMPNAGHTRLERAEPYKNRIRALEARIKELEAKIIK